jgi:hypothetical protein
MTEEYNGWANRETWAAALYFDNDEGLSNQAREIIEAAFEAALRKYPTEKIEDRLEARRLGIWEAASALEQLFEQLLTRAGYEQEFGSPWPAALADMAGDIGSLYRVDEEEIAEAWLEDTLRAFDQETAAEEVTA